MSRGLGPTFIGVILLLIGFVAGVYAGQWNFERVMLDPIRDEKAILASIRVQTLSQLRLGEINEVIEQQEMMLDNEARILRQKSTRVLYDDPAEMPEAVYRALRAIKGYRLLYPATGTMRAKVDDYLSIIPAYTDEEIEEKECGAALWRQLKRSATGDGLTTETLAIP